MDENVVPVFKRSKMQRNLLVKGHVNIESYLQTRSGQTRRSKYIQLTLLSCNGPLVENIILKCGIQCISFCHYRQIIKCSWSSHHLAAEGIIAGSLESAN